MDTRTRQRSAGYFDRVERGLCGMASVLGPRSRREQFQDALSGGARLAEWSFPAKAIYVFVPGMGRRPGECRFGRCGMSDWNWRPRCLTRRFQPGFFPCLSGCLSICRAKAFAKFRFRNRGHAERNSVAGEGGDGTESKYPVAAPQASGRPSCIPRDPSTARRPAFALAALAQDDLRFCMPLLSSNRISMVLSLSPSVSGKRQRGNSERARSWHGARCNLRRMTHPAGREPLSKLALARSLPPN